MINPKYSNKHTHTKNGFTSTQDNLLDSKIRQCFYNFSHSTKTLRVTVLTRRYILPNKAFKNTEHHILEYDAHTHTHTHLLNMQTSNKTGQMTKRTSMLPSTRQEMHSYWKICTRSQENLPCMPNGKDISFQILQGVPCSLTCCTYQCIVFCSCNKINNTSLIHVYI